MDTVTLPWLASQETKLPQCKLASSARSHRAPGLCQHGAGPPARVLPSDEVQFAAPKGAARPRHPPGCYGHRLLLLKSGGLSGRPQRCSKVKPDRGLHWNSRSENKGEGSGEGRSCPRHRRRRGPAEEARPCELRAARRGAANGAGRLCPRLRDSARSAPPRHGTAPGTGGSPGPAASPREGRRAHLVLDVLLPPFGGDVRREVLGELHPAAGPGAAPAEPQLAAPACQRAAAGTAGRGGASAAAHGPPPARPRRSSARLGASSAPPRSRRRRRLFGRRHLPRPAAASRRQPPASQPAAGSAASPRQHSPPPTAGWGRGLEVGAWPRGGGVVYR